MSDETEVDAEEYAPVATRYKRLDDLPDLSTRHQVAEYLQVSVAALDKWAMSGDGPRRVKYGRAVRYRRSDISDFVDGLT